MAVLIACILLGLILAVLFRNSPRHREAVARRAARNHERNRQLHARSAYRRAHIHEITDTRKAEGFRASLRKSREIREESYRA